MYLPDCPLLCLVAVHPPLGTCFIRLHNIGKNESEEKRELIFKEDGQGETIYAAQTSSILLTAVCLVQ